MTRQGGASTRPKQSKSAIEKASGFLNAIGTHAASREFNCKCYPVKLAADCANNLRIGVAWFKGVPACRYALDEKLHRREGEYLHGSELGVIWGAFQRRKLINMLTFDSQRFPTRRQNMHLRSLLKDALCQCGSCLNHVLTTIQQQ